MASQGVDNVVESMDLPEDEEIEDLPMAEMEADPLRNAKIQREVNGSFFDGVVETIEVGKQTNERLYRIAYADGDCEHLTREQVLQCQVHDAAGTSRASAQQLQSNAMEDDSGEDGERKRGKGTSKAATSKPAASVSGSAVGTAKVAAKSKAKVKAKGKGTPTVSANATPSNANGTAKGTAKAKGAAKAVMKKPGAR
eukprot:TRINITY_DN48929_c0_g1_i1.p1 TRINITY_DN48929_c0_g1~~TRINITY_DN48929_c0_g1_i1.p1  ORF type:complete len:214 (-),score=41.34 TRINITY_DN48929_c0_g1_i1:78-668(-)